VRNSTASPSRHFAAGESVAVRWDVGAERVFDADQTPLPPHFLEPISTRMTSHV